MSNVIVTEIDLLKSKDLNRFINLPWSIYKDDPTWVPPLKMAVKDVLNTKKHPFYKTAEVKAFIATKDGVDVGRVLAVNNKAYNQFHNTKKGHFGFYETINDQKVSDSLLDACAKYFKAKNLEELEGPMNPGTNYECGLLVEGVQDDPQVMMTYNPKYYEPLIKNYGLEKIQDLLAYETATEFQMPKIIMDIAERTKKKEHVTLRTINLKNWNKELEILFDIYNKAWEKNWGFVPMTKEEFLHTAKDLKSILNPELIHIAEVNGVAAGFILTLPDLNRVFKQIPSGNLSPMAIYKILTPKKRIDRCRVITMGVKKEFRKMGIETLLYTHNHEAIKKQNLYKKIEMSWILDDNLEMNKPLIRMGANPYKRYRIYHKSI
jgi:hypothetical protein